MTTDLNFNSKIDFFLHFNKSKHMDARGSNVELRAAYRLSLGR